MFLTLFIGFRSLVVSKPASLDMAVAVLVIVAVVVVVFPVLTC